MVAEIIPNEHLNEAAECIKSLQVMSEPLDASPRPETSLLIQLERLDLREACLEEDMAPWAYIPEEAIFRTVPHDGSEEDLKMKRLTF